MRSITEYFLRKSGEASGNVPQCRLKLCGKAMG